MFRYVADISTLAQDIISKYLVNKGIAVDATLGNGHDTDFLALNFEKVYAFDIQPEPCKEYESRAKENVQVINDSHHKFDEYIKESPDCIMYNLGYLPQGKKEITTLHETSLKSIDLGLNMLKSGGIMTICIYRGHSEGAIEESCILDFLQKLDRKIYGVMLHSYLNRSNQAPVLVIIEKK